jgi:glutathione peroxidase-family protein/YHS domain-containing protein
MRIRMLLAVLTTTAALAGALPNGSPTPVLAAPKTAVCTVCDEGEEPVKATAKHQGKEHYFCSEQCRRQFLADPSTYPKVQEPWPAPAFSLKDLDGKTVSLAEYRDRVVLVGFWATFSSPSVKLLPKLQKLGDRHAARGFAVVAIATDEGGAKLVAPVAAKSKVGFPILISTEEAWEEYDVRSVPTLFLIDRSGKVVKQFSGSIDEKRLEQEVRKVVGG